MKLLAITTFVICLSTSCSGTSTTGATDITVSTPTTTPASGQSSTTAGSTTKTSTTVVTTFRPISPEIVEAIKDNEPILSTACNTTSCDSVKVAFSNSTAANVCQNLQAYINCLQNACHNSTALNSASATALKPCTGKDNGAERNTFLSGLVMLVSVLAFNLFGR
ncbi:hypothetical protein Btru_072358 [Bulinus truncatus]|nr:hypothetical protein Btru_072358 [Bulinus truncatus]